MQSDIKDTIAELGDMTKEHDEARRAMRRRLLDLGDEELLGLYYDAITLAEHEAERRGRAPLLARVEELEGALGAIEQRANESGTGEMGLLNTVHDMHAIARAALQGEDKP